MELKQGVDTWKLDTNYGTVATAYYNLEPDGKFSVILKVNPQLYGSSMRITSFQQAESGEIRIILREVKE